MSARIHIVNFGQSNGGLATVGYTLLNIDGTTKVSRSTSGVVEYGSSTGIYGSNIDYNQFDQVVVLWDTGGATPRYAVEENRTTLAMIQEETDHIRMIWNTLKNQGEVFLTLLKAIKRLENLKNYDDEFQKVLDQIKKLIDREIIQIKDIKEALKITVNPPAIKMPKSKGTSDADLSELIKNLEDIKETLKNKNSDDRLGIVNNNIKTVGSILEQLVKVMPKEDLVSALKENLKYLKEEENKCRISRLKNLLKV